MALLVRLKPSTLRLLLLLLLRAAAPITQNMKTKTLNSRSSRARSFKTGHPNLKIRGPQLLSKQPRLPKPS